MMTVKSQLFSIGCILCPFLAAQHAQRARGNRDFRAENLFTQAVAARNQLALSMIMTGTAGMLAVRRQPHLLFCGMTFVAGRATLNAACRVYRAANDLKALKQK